VLADATDWNGGEGADGTKHLQENLRVFKGRLIGNKKNKKAGWCKSQIKNPLLDRPNENKKAGRIFTFLFLSRINAAAKP
jgi:hypothetical protein